VAGGQDGWRARAENGGPSCVSGGGELESELGASALQSLQCNWASGPVRYGYFGEEGSLELFAQASSCLSKSKKSRISRSQQAKGCQCA
jgi:hypothetical protein